MPWIKGQDNLRQTWYGNSWKTAWQPGGLWTPAYINTYCWYDASNDHSLSYDINNKVSVWEDLSGNGLHQEQPNASRTPTTNIRNINGLNALHFGGFMRRFGMGEDTDDVILVWVADMDATTPGGTSDTMIAARWLASVKNGGGATPVWKTVIDSNGNASFGALVGTTQQGGPQMGSWSFSVAGDGRLFRMGNLERTAFTSQGSNSTSDLTIGGANSSGAGGFSGGIGEIIMVNNESSDKVRQLIEGYLAWKWGLTFELPIDHPYKFFPPRA